MTMMGAYADQTDIPKNGIPQTPIQAEKLDEPEREVGVWV